MVSIDAILTAQPDAVRALVEGDLGAWKALLEHLVEHGPKSAPDALVVALMEHTPDFDAWQERAKGAAVQIESDYFATSLSAVRPFRAWLVEGVSKALPATHPAVIGARYEAARASAGNADDVARVGSLLADLGGPSHPRWVDVLVLLARRLDEAGDTDGALATIRRAEEACRARDDAGGAAQTRRFEGGLLLVAGRFDEAFAILDPVMNARGRLFGGVRGASVMRDGAGAAGEAATIASWASATTPEWVRALGGVAEEHGERHPALHERFATALSALATVSDLEVVVRQASQRDHRRTARRAAELLAERFPTDLEAADVAARFFAEEDEHEKAMRTFLHAAEANPDDGFAWLSTAEAAASAGVQDVARAAVARAAETIAVDDDREVGLRLVLARVRAEHAPRSREAADALFAELGDTDPELLCETEIGQTFTDATIGALIAVRDPRAVDAAEILHAAKLAAFGECPAGWLEQHNVGSVCAQLGDFERARALVAPALEALREQLGDEHPHVAMAQRTLDRIEREAKGG